jgi:predicted PurR-regulated permease PerM
MNDRLKPAKTVAPPYVFPTLLILVTLAFLALIGGFYKAIVWAFVFALLSTPLYEWLRTRFGQRDMLAAAATTLVVVILVLVPAVGFGMVLAGQASGLVQGIQDGAIDPASAVRWLMDLVPRAERAMEGAGIDVGNLSTRISEGVASGGEYLAAQALTLGQGALRTSLTLALTIYLLFFFLYDGRRIMNFIHEALPIEGPGERYLMQEIGGVTQATVKGIIVIGLVQGAIGGVAFALLGINNALLWGVAIAIASILPVVGTAIIWVPAAIVLFAGGTWVKGLLMLMTGVFLIGMIDNLLRPRVVGRDTQMPDYVVLLATLGGLGTFGLTGLVLGPLIAGLFFACWRMYRPKLSGNSDVPHV